MGGNGGWAGVPDGMDDEIDCPASAEGIAHCLRMLTEEAATLKLSRTLAALQQALATCENEGLRPGAAPRSAGDVTLH
jgi:hypothetical protein